MEWYYSEEGRRVGPLAEEEFRKLVDSGRIAQETLVWHQGMQDWAAYGRITESSASGTEGACTVCNRPFPHDELIPYQDATVCAECKPEFFQRLKEGAALPGVMEFGGFWIRAGAWFIDRIVCTTIFWIVAAVFAAIAAAITATSENIFIFLGLQIVMQVLYWAMVIGYSTFFVGRFGATPGKMACRLRVVRSDMGKVTYGIALGRCFGKALSYITVGVGFLMAAFDEEKRTLHDRICDTRVIRTRA